MQDRISTKLISFSSKKGNSRHLKIACNLEQLERIAFNCVIIFQNGQLSICILHGWMRYSYNDWHKFIVSWLIRQCSNSKYSTGKWKALFTVDLLPFYQVTFPCSDFHLISHFHIYIYPLYSVLYTLPKYFNTFQSPPPLHFEWHGPHLISTNESICPKVHLIFVGWNGHGTRTDARKSSLEEVATKILTET